VKLIGTHSLELKKESVNVATFFIIVDQKEIKERKSELKVGVYQNGEKIQTVKTTFLGPFI